jgi:hypothetical protein
MSKKGRLLSVAVILTYAASAVWAQEKPEREVSEKLIGKIDVSTVIGHSLTASPDAKRFAYEASAGYKQWVVVDGKKGKEYCKVGDNYHYRPIFSPDSKRLAYQATIESSVEKMCGEKMCIVVDGKEGKEYDAVEWPVFSPDSKRIGYIAIAGGKVEGRLILGGKKFIVVDGNEEKQYDRVLLPVFSPDSKRLAYCASVEREEGFPRTREDLVVVDGKEVSVYQNADINIPVFSPDSKRVAYSVDNREPQTNAEQGFVVLDGVPGKAYNRVGWWPVFSPDSNHIAYRAGIGKIIAPFHPVKETFSKEFIVLDGKEQTLYDSVCGPLVFSPDGKRLAYAACGERGWFIVVDGKEGKRCDITVLGLYCVFSPDSRRLAYKASAGEKKSVVVDEVEGKQYDDVRSLIFSPDSKSVAYIARTGDKEFVVVNGREGKQYDNILSEIIFDSDNVLHYLALSGNAVYLVEEKLK